MKPFAAPQVNPLYDEVVEGVVVMKRSSPVHIGCTLFLIAAMGWVFFEIKDVSNAHLPALQKHLGPSLPLFAGWSSGVDQADVQWKDLVKNLPLLGPALLVICLLARLIRLTSPSALLSDRLQVYYCATGILFIGYLHGAPAAFAIVLVLFNYFAIAPLCRVLPFKLFMLIMWTFHVGILFVNDHFRGYRFSLFSDSLRFIDESWPSGVLRWNVVFNMCTLRMIAFNNDYYEAFTVQQHGDSSRVASKTERHLATCTDCAALRATHPASLSLSDVSCHCYKLRTETPRPLSEYHLKGYLGYLFYVPLYVAGPMSSYNGFISHTHFTTRSMSIRQGLVYLLRIGNLFALLTLQLHFNFLNAIREERDVFDAMRLGVKLGFFLFTLGFLWMKFNFLWKFFRLMAFIDGVEAPEDMNRCFADTLTIQSFWKDWHSSFNLWIVRYMYIPMGGNKNRLLSIFPIFIFIAVWHDIELHLLWWAMIMCVAFIPEVIVGILIARPQMKWLRVKPYYRYVRAAGGAVGMCVLITANLVGYGTGTRNTSKGLSEALSWETGQVLFGVFSVLYCGAVVAVRDRDAKEGEKRRLRAVYGIKLDHRHE